MCRLYILLQIILWIFFSNYMSTKCDCKTEWLWVRSLLEEMKYLFNFLFSFFRHGVEAKRSVEFCQSARNASRIRQKVGNGLNTKFHLSIPLFAGYSVKLITYSDAYIPIVMYQYVLNMSFSFSQHCYKDIPGLYC